MEGKEKVISLFKYIKELYAQRYKVVVDIKNQEWAKFISDIPNTENIIINYMDRTEEEVEKITDNTVLLEVIKPEFEKLPILPDILKDWLEEGWDDFNQALKKIDKKIKNDLEEDKNYDAENIKLENFEDDKDRIEVFKKFKKERDSWVRKQIIIDKTRKLFNDLYAKYIDLERDSETIELMVGQGILDCDMLDGKRSFHPILMKKVAIEFNALDNIIKIVDIDSEPEIYTMLLQGISFINHSAIKTLKDELLENYYHPLDRKEALNFLKRLTHSLHSESKFIENEEENFKSDDKLLIHNKPVFFIRKRTSGVMKSIEEIIKQLEEKEEISGPLLNLIGENSIQFEEIKESLDINQNLSAVSGEDRDILLSKEANREQLEIAKRIENYNAVLVQGPPGTGKTHTIANLMGHFLAQGKNILVTSHTKKALTVVKEKLPKELQPLCVSVLDNNSKDMEKSIDGITEYISSHSSLELLKNIEELKHKRNEIMNELDSVRKEIFAIKHKEFEAIRLNGESYTSSQAAKFVYDNRNELSYIPGKVQLGKIFPISESDLELLYKTNEIISLKDEQELGSFLPNPTMLITSEEFENAVKIEKEVIEENNKIIQDLGLKNLELDYNNFTIKVNGENLCTEFNEENLKNLQQYLTENSLAKDKIDLWCSYAILDGKKGGGFKAIWQKLAQNIEDTYKYASDNVMLLLGKNIEANLTKSNQTIISLNEMKEHIAKGKKINSFSFFKPKEWTEIYAKAKINGNNIDTVEDCSSLIAFLELAMKREEISRLWYELIEKKEGESFKNFGAEPEQIAINYVEKIKNSISWYDTIFSYIENLIKKTNLNSDILFGKQNYTANFNDIENLIKNIYLYLPKYINILINMNSKLSEANTKYEKMKIAFTDEETESSGIAKNLLTAFEARNKEEYRKYYEILLQLFEKNNYINERQRILSNIKEVAPEWAELIKNRIGIHGKSEVPKNIKEAWKWKQFAGFIEEITALPFEELQYKAVALAKDLRKITTELVENLSWYHLFNRIEKDFSQKQALQGWKLTVKKIGKGTGKTAPALRREAQKLMAKCQMAVPAWVMPVNKALESLDPKTNKFDIVIIDEASQSDISALAILYLAKKIIIVGDDEQVSPSAVGLDVDKMTNLANMYIKGIIPNAHLYDMKSSLYDIAKTTFPTLMLREHFRCVPDIIGYSNRLSYEYKIRALRDDSNVTVKPATISYKVKDGARNLKQKINVKEAESIVALMLACMDFDEYKNMSFGAISLLGEEQAAKINSLAMEKISPLDFERRKILCGDASHFQGDERDVIFISLVDSNHGDVPLRLAGEGTGKSTKQRYNVAVSRAKNQLWLIHSLDVFKDLKTGDMRKELIEYTINPENFKENIKQSSIKIDSQLEEIIAKSLKDNGYNVVQDWKVGIYRIDMVVQYEKNKIAIECDSDLYNSGKDTIREDLEKQAVLERLGWRFIRIRGSEYYSNPIKTIEHIMEKIKEFGIQAVKNVEKTEKKDELKEKVIARMEEILKEWEEVEDKRKVM